MTSLRFRFARRAAGALAAAISFSSPHAAAQAAQAIMQPILRSSTATPPADLLPPRVVVRLRPGHGPLPAAAIHALSVRAGWNLEWVRSLADGSHVLAVSSSSVAPTAATLVEALRAAPEVERVDEDLTMSVGQLPNDPELPRLWNLKAIAAASFGADFEAAWATTTGRPELVVALIDTGVLPHPDLVGSGGTVLPPTGALASEGYDFISDCRVRGSCPAGTAAGSAKVAPTPDATDLGDWISNSDRSYSIFSNCKRRDSTWHGTHVAGIVAALAGNSEGIAGAAFGVRLLPIRALGKCGGYMSDVSEAIRYAAGVHPMFPNPTPARVLNLSIGGIGTCSATLQAAIDAASAAGAVVVVAAGNDGGDAAEAVLPSCANVVAVAATTRAGEIASYSNQSATRVALSAPGGDSRAEAGAAILSTMNTGSTTHDPSGWTYAERVGTSSAAPHVAAAAALLLVRNPALSPPRVLTALTAEGSVASFAPGSTCIDTGACGTGILDAGRAVANANTLLTASVDTLRFGNLRLGDSAQRELLVSNASAVPVAVGNARITGAAGYSLIADQCSEQHLAPGQACRVSVRFEAGSNPGIEVATLLLTTPSSNSALVSVPLVAAVGSHLDSPHPLLTLPPSPIGVATSVELTFTNLSTMAERLLPLRIVGNPDVQVIVDGCSNVEIAAGQTCSVTLALKSAVAGAFKVEVSANTDGHDDVPFGVTIDFSAIDGSAIDGTDVATAERSVTASSGGGGGCTILASGGAPDATLAILALGLLGWRSVRRGRNARRGSRSPAPRC